MTSTTARFRRTLVRLKPVHGRRVRCLQHEFQTNSREVEAVTVDTTQTEIGQFQTNSREVEAQLHCRVGERAHAFQTNSREVEAVVTLQ